MKKLLSSSEQGKGSRATDPPGKSWYSNPWTIAIVVLALACQAYAAVMRAPFLFDDFGLPYTSPLISDAPFSAWVSGVRPLLMLTYWLNYQPPPSSTLAYHLTNVGLHALNSLLVFGICRRLFSLHTPDTHRVFVTSAFACSLFLLHPLQTESVAYVAGRSEVLSASFVLVAWLIYVRRIGSPVSGRQVLAILFLFGLAATTKEQAVATLPAIFLLTDYLVRRDSLWTELRANKRLYVPLGIGAVAGAIWVSTILFGSRSAGPNAGISSAEYLMTQTRAVWLYLRLFLVPVGQNADREFSISRTIYDQGTLLALCGLLVAVFLLLKLPPLVRYGGLLFLAFLAPTSSIVPLADAFAERRMYLPIVGLAIAVSAALVHVSLPTRRLALTCAALAAVAFFATSERARVWSDGVSFWKDVVEKSPNKARAYQHLTHAYITAGRCEEAVGALEKARDAMPRDYFTLVDWAQAYTCANNPAAAFSKLQEAEKLMPTAVVYGLMGDSLLKLGRITEAQQAFAKAIANEPPGTDLAHVYQGNLALLANNRIQAHEEYRQAIALNPYSPEAGLLLRRLDPETDRNSRSRATAPPSVNSLPGRLPGQFVDRRHAINP